MAATRPGIAGLPMYDMPALAWATDALWAAVARDLAGHGMAGVPDRLRRDIEPETSCGPIPTCLLAQTCGLPLVTLLDGRVRFVATPIYAIDGCSGGDYRSWLVVRVGDGRRSIADLEGSIAAVNAPHSQSGANALAAMTAPVAKGHAFFADIRLTGAHAASLAAVSSGAADCAAIDCVTWALLAQSVPEVHCWARDPGRQPARTVAALHYRPGARRCHDPGAPPGIEHRSGRSAGHRRLPKARLCRHRRDQRGRLPTDPRHARIELVGGLQQTLRTAW